MYQSIPRIILTHNMYHMWAVADLGGAGVGHGPPPLAHPQKFS